MDAGEPKVAQSGIVSSIPVSDDRRGHEPLVLQQPAHQAQCRDLVASGLNKDVENLTFIIDSAPQIHLSVGDRDEDFVTMPSCSRRRAPGPAPTRIDRTEMGHPSADRLIRDDDPALSEQVLDIPEAEHEAQIQPDGMLDDRRRESIAEVAGLLHRQMLPDDRYPGHGSPPV